MSFKKLTYNKQAKHNIKSQLRYITNYLDDIDNLCDNKSFQMIHKIQCYIQSKLELYNTASSLISEPSKDFPNIILEYKKLGKKNQQGTVYRVTIELDSNKKVYAILKYGKGYHRTIETVLHEVAVGFMLNNLRENGNLNFMYSYAPFYCSTGKDLCSSNVKTKVTTCAFFEYVSGFTLSDFIKQYINQDEEATVEMFIKLLFQVSLALSDAQKLCKFIHYDLHDENILITYNETPVDLTYKYAKYKLTNVNYVVTIIDYGNSVVENKNIPQIQPLLDIINSDSSKNGDKTLFMTPFTDSQVKIKYFEELAYSKEPYIGCYDIFHLSMMCMSSMVANENISMNVIQKVWKILMTFFINRLSSVNVSQKCKKFLTEQKFTFESLYYRLKLSDKELVDISMQNYVEYLNAILELPNFSELE